MRDARTILITGATDGLGRSLADRLAAGGAQVILHGRDPIKLERTARELSCRHGCPDPLTICADLADLRQVHDMAEAVPSLTSRLDVLVNNAGIGFGAPGDEHRQLSADGHELRFAVNHLAGFTLTLRLLAPPAPFVIGPDRARCLDRSESDRFPGRDARTLSVAMEKSPVVAKSRSSLVAK